MRLSSVLRCTIPMFFLLAVGCVSENKGKLEGTRWESDAGTLQVKTGYPGGKQSVTVPAGFMELDFQTDGTLFYIINKKLYRGRYTLNAGQAVTLHLEEALAGLKTHTETIRVDGNRMTMIDTDGTKLNFSKVD